jgi:hypothetical protein
VRTEMVVVSERFMRGTPIGGKVPPT